jgi:hypothetical protein
VIAFSVCASLEAFCDLKKPNSCPTVASDTTLRVLTWSDFHVRDVYTYQIEGSSVSGCVSTKSMDPLYFANFHATDSVAPSSIRHLFLTVSRTDQSDISIPPLT